MIPSAMAYIVALTIALFKRNIAPIQLMNMVKLEQDIKTISVGENSQFRFLSIIGILCKYSAKKTVSLCRKKLYFNSFLICRHYYWRIELFISGFHLNYYLNIDNLIPQMFAER